MLESSADLLQIIWSRILVEIALPCCVDGVTVAKIPSRETKWFHPSKGVYYWYLFDGLMHGIIMSVI